MVDEARGVVPTERELRLGRVVIDEDASTETRQMGTRGDPAPEPRQSIGERLRRFKEDVDPRTFGSPYGARPLVLIAIFTIAGGLDDNIVLTLGPEIRAEFGVSLAQIASVSALIKVAENLWSPALGYLSDRVNRVVMLTVGQVVSNLCSVLSSFAPSIGAFQLARTAQGSASSVYEPVLFPLISDWYPQSARVRAFSALGIAGRISALVSPVLVGGIALLLGWRSAIFILAAIATVLSFGFLLLPNPPRGYVDRLSMGLDEEAAADEAPPVSWNEAWRSAASIVTVRRIWYATPFLGAGGTTIALLLANFYYQELGLNSFARGGLVALQAASGIVALGMFGRAADRLVTARPSTVMLLFAFANGVLVVPTIMIVLLPIAPVAIILGLAIGVLATLLGPAFGSLLSLVVSSRLRGLGLQTFKPWAIAGQLLSIPFAGLGDSLGLVPAILIASSLFVIGSVILASAAGGIQADIRAARAAELAEEESRKAKAEGRTKLLVVRDVDVTYDAAQVLFNVDLDVTDGELLALVGTNGAGKSTLLRAIAGVQEASNGAIFLDGVDITHRPPAENAAAGVVFVPGGRAIFPSLSVAENLKTAGFLRRDDPSWVAQRIEEVYDLFPALRERSHQAAGNMSGGEQQMLAVGQAFLIQPKLLMIDELSLGLAPAVVERLLEVVRAINAAGTTIILVEQSLNIALTIARRAVFMDKGRIEFDGPVGELLGRGDLVRAVFLAGGGGTMQPARGRRRPAIASDGMAEIERVLTVDGVRVRFGGVQALDGAAATVDAGQVVGIIGPNGAGKTTLFDCISGFVKPDGGVVEIGGVDALGLSPDARARLGLARSFQNARLFPSMTVRENIAVSLETQLAVRSAVLTALWAPQVRRSERRIRRRVEYLISLFALEPFADKFVSELSTGSRRIVDLACITATEPKLLLLDEPSSGLAQAETEALGPVVRRLARDTRCGVLVIEHDLPLVTSLSDHLIAMELGHPIAEGRPDDVIANPRVVDAYLGADPAVIERSGPLTAALEAAGLASGPAAPATTSATTSASAKDTT